MKPEAAPKEKCAAAIEHIRLEPILIDIHQLAAVLGLSKRLAYDLLRRHSAMAEGARVVLSERCVRYRLAVVRDYIANLPTLPAQHEPAKLKRGRHDAFVAKRDIAASFCGDKGNTAGGPSAP
jgi:hypothetical protein